MIIVIGAGLVGLTCAQDLVRAGENVLVLEASDQVGGRVRTDIHKDGFHLDRGFQVLFTSYPSAKRHLTFDELKPRKFEPGAILIKNGNRMEIPGSLPYTFLPIQPKAIKTLQSFKSQNRHCY